MAGHGAQRQRVDDEALGVDSARFDDLTRLDAFAIEAGVFGRTFAIRRAARLSDGRFLCKNKLIKIRFRLTISENEFLTWQVTSLGRVGLAKVAGRADTFGHVVDDGAAGAGRAVARVAAILLATGQFGRTVLVDEAFGLTAGPVRIAFVALRTEALGSMEGDSADGLGAARLEHARILTLTVDARLFGRTIGIGSTADGEALNLRVSSESLGADADGPVLDNSALGVGSADGGPFDARVDATLFDAGLGRLAVRVHFALDLDDRLDDGRTRLAPDERIAGEAAGAGADGIVADDLAPGVESASAGTRIATALVDAGQIVGAIGIGGAFRLAGHVRVTLESRKADAGVAVSAGRSAFRVGSARIRRAGDLLAIHGPLSFDGDGSAGRERIAFVTFAAGADGHVVGHSALGVGSAGVRARILATIPHAAPVSRAVRVEDALGPAGAVRVADVVRRAAALGPAAHVAAFRVQSARRWRAALGRLDDVRLT